MVALEGKQRRIISKELVNHDDVPSTDCKHSLIGKSTERLDIQTIVEREIFFFKFRIIKLFLVSKEEL